MIPYDNWHIGADRGPFPPTAKERRQGRLVLLAVAAVFLLLAFAFAGCASSHPVDARHNAELQAPKVKLNADSSSQKVPSSMPNVASSAHNVASSTEKVASSASKGTKPSLLSGIGNIFSTPEGRANRQARRLAKASTPKVGKGGVLAINSNVSNGFKSTAAVVTADTGATVSTNGANGLQQTVKGDGNDLKAHKQDTTKEAPSGWATFIDNLTGPLGYVLAGALVLAFVAWRVEKKAA